MGCISDCNVGIFWRTMTCTHLCSATPVRHGFVKNRYDDPCNICGEFKSSVFVCYFFSSFSWCNWFVLGIWAVTSFSCALVLIGWLYLYFFQCLDNPQPLASAYGLAKHRDGRWEWAIAPGVSPSSRYQHAAVSVCFMPFINCIFQMNLLIIFICYVLVL